MSSGSMQPGPPERDEFVTLRSRCGDALVAAA